MSETKQPRLEWRRPSELTPNPLNWRRHPQAQTQALQEALTRVGWAGVLLYNERSGHLLDGHARQEIAGDELAPVLIGDWSEEDERFILATLDPITMLADTDKANLEALLAQVMPTVTEPGIAALLESIARDNGFGLQVEGLTDPDAIPEVPEPFTQPGDLWLLGQHRVLCGDATSAIDTDRLMGGELAAMLWTDPPYGVEYVGKTEDALRISNDGAEGLALLLQESFANAVACLQPGSPFYIAHPAGALAIIFWTAAVGAGMQIHEDLVWVKDSMVLGHADYHYRHEPILYGWTAGQGRSGRGKHTGTRWYGNNAQTSVFEVPRPKASRDHPTSKPTALIEIHLGNSSRPMDLILDPFLGSGSTLIAAERLGRRCFGLELDPRYVDVIVRRWAEYTGLEPARVSNTEDSAQDA